MPITTDISTFVQQMVSAMGLEISAETDQQPDGVRVSLSGEDGHVLLRRQGEALSALQHIASAVYRQDAAEARRLVLDCLNFRKSKDTELRQMALFLAEKARATGLAQEMGPLNSYERRIVHMAVAEVETVTSESVGDASEKTVIISVQ